MRLPDRKTLRQAYWRVMRQPGSPARTGRGVASGLFVAFIVPFGLHMVLALGLAVLVRGARFAAACATWVTNPLTVPIIYPVQCYVGGYLVGRPLSYALVSRTVGEVLRQPSWHAVSAVGHVLALPFVAGGLLFGSVAALAGYWISVALQTRFRERRQARRARRGLPVI